MITVHAERGEKMLTNRDGYSLIYYKSRNQIVIGLPQTLGSLTNTINLVADRKIDVEEKDLAILLAVTQAIFLNGAKMDEVEDV